MVKDEVEVLRAQSLQVINRWREFLLHVGLILAQPMYTSEHDWGS